MLKSSASIVTVALLDRNVSCNFDPPMSTPSNLLSSSIRSSSTETLHQRQTVDPFAAWLDRAPARERTTVAVPTIAATGMGADPRDVRAFLGL